MVFPADVLKSRLQVAESAVATASGTTAAPNSAWQLARQLLKTHGIGVFYKGVGAAVLRAFPANGALFAGVEVTRAALNRYSD